MPGASAASVRALADGRVPGRAAPAPVAGRWADLRLRTLSAAVLAPAALLCVWYGDGAWVALISAVALGLGLEWAALCGYGLASVPGMAVPAALLAASGFILLGHEGLALALLAAAVPLVWRLGGVWLAVGIPYIGIPLWALSWLRERPSTGAAVIDGVGRADVLFVLLVVWASDIGAYAAGRLLGGPKLAPAISPGKTRSGAVGGLVTAMLVGEAAARYLAPGGPWRAAALAGLIAVASQAGDLFESWVKRRFGVKDSGWLIPGHGGLLDRLDGLLAAAPVAVMLAMMFGRGGVLWK